jgi:hypothetical protein
MCTINLYLPYLLIGMPTAQTRRHMVNSAACGVTNLESPLSPSPWTGPLRVCGGAINYPLPHRPRTAKPRLQGRPQSRAALFRVYIHEEVSELMKPHSGSSFLPYFKLPVQALQWLQWIGRGSGRPVQGLLCWFLPLLVEIGSFSILLAIFISKIEIKYVTLK